MTDKPFKPMLAGKAPDDHTTMSFPVLASPKLDGIRCIIRDGVPVSRKLKPIPNLYVQRILGELPDGIDGELMVEGGFNACQSAFMSKGDGKPFNFFFFAFDWDREARLGRDNGFAARLEALTRWSEDHGHPNLFVVEHVEITDHHQLNVYEREELDRGMEGVMTRDPNGPYKYGRSTTREGYLLKVKRFVDEEATITGVVERMHNGNEQERDALGHAKRSHAKAGMVPMDTLGAFKCVTEDGAEFQVGTGFDEEQRASYWKNRDEMVGKTITFKHQPDPGGRQPGQAPRFPVFLGFRHDL